jgi:hypothetical protein
MGFFEQSIIDAIFKLGFFPTKSVNKSKLIQLIEKLRPVNTRHKMCRMGPEKDGGYVLPDDLDDINTCISPGVGDTVGFEKECANRGIDVVLADGTIEAPPCEHEKFHFVNKDLSHLGGDRCVSLEKIWQSFAKNKTGDLIIQMDIEGDEYKVIPSMSRNVMKSTRIMIIEFHGLQHMFSEPLFEIISSTFEKLLHNHTCVHIHPNNCREEFRIGGISIPKDMEFTFLRDDRILEPTPATSFPHPLDCKNADTSSLPLPEIWYEND